jgi:hypothetical protein
MSAPAQPALGFALFFMFGIVAETLFAAFLIWWLRGVRLFVTAFSLLNIGLVSYLAFIAFVAASGL